MEWLKRLISCTERSIRIYVYVSYCAKLVEMIQSNLLKPRDLSLRDFEHRTNPYCCGETR